MREDVKEELQQRVERARRVVILTGAGVSAESGVPTFRGADGLWRQYRAEDLATPVTFSWWSEPRRWSNRPPCSP